MGCLPVYGAAIGWCFEGQQSKEHLLTHCRFETGASAVAAFGAFGAHRVCPVRASNPAAARIEWGRNTFQRDELDPQNTETQITWSAKRYV